MRLSASIFLAFALAAAPADAANDQVQRGPAPNWVVPSELMPVPEGASGLAFVRRQDFLMHLDARGQEQYLGTRVKILHQNALQLGNVQIAWNPAAGAPTVHAIRIYREGQMIDVLANTQFEVLRREGQLEAASLDGMLTAVLRVPDLRVGDELELGMTIRMDDPTLGGTVAGVLMVAPAPPPGRMRLGLSWDEGQEPHLRMTPDMAAIAERGARSITLRFDNAPALALPNEAPPRYLWQRVVEYSDFADWQAVSRQFAPLYRRAATLAPQSPLKAEAQRIAAANPDPLARANAALRLVQQQVRYIYVGLNGGNLTPATADETWRRRYGDCKAKTALLLALLAELGIDAEPVLVNANGGDDGLDERLPSSGLFDHVIVRARINGTNYWLDGTFPPVVDASAATVQPYRWVLPLTAQGSALQRLEWHPAEQPDEMALLEIDARAGFDHPARITSTTITRGIPGLQQQIQFSGMTQEQLLTGFRQQGFSNIWQNIENVQWRYDARTQASVLTITGTGTAEWEDDGDGAKSMRLPGGGFNPPERRIRPAGQPQDVPYYNAPSFSCRVTTVRLPENTQTSRWSYNTSFDTRMFGRNYHRALELRDGAIRMVRGSRVEQQEVDVAAARRDNDRISSFDNSMAVITYDPTRVRNNPSAGFGARVPATYEIDWTGAQVPCLGAATAGQGATPRAR